MLLACDPALLKLVREFEGVVLHLQDLLEAELVGKELVDASGREVLEGVPLEDRCIRCEEVGVSF